MADGIVPASWWGFTRYVLKKMGPMDQLMSMVPGMGKVSQSAVDENALDRVEAIINSMTPEERRKPVIIDGSRRKRISVGSGTTIQDVNRLLRQFESMKKMMKQYGKQGRRSLPGLNPFGS